MLAQDVLAGALMRRLKVLLSAYSCEPHKGSEPGVGWNVACEMAKDHEVWVLTRANNRAVIEAELAQYPVSQLHFVYYDLPHWLSFWKKGGRGLQAYYYLWQLGSYALIRALHRRHQFDLSHHITFGRYWSPSLLSLLPIPFIWGPVGGGESIPASFRQELWPTEKRFERLRDIARWLGEHDPLLRLTARRSTLALATSAETMARLKQLGCSRIELLAQVAMTDKAFAQLSTLPAKTDTKLRFLSIGRALHWKGFYLGIRGFARAQLPDSEYCLLTSGPQRAALEHLVEELGIAKQVFFIDSLASLDDVYRLLASADVLVHPALHEAFGNVVLEAMTAAKPVICLDLGGPATQVNSQTGFKIPAHHPEQAVQDIAKAMTLLAQDKSLRMRLGQMAQARVQEHFHWRKMRQSLTEAYQSSQKSTP